MGHAIEIAVIAGSPYFDMNLEYLIMGNRVNGDIRKNCKSIERYQV